jgi:hypothetical protein
MEKKRKRLCLMAAVMIVCVRATPQAQAPTLVVSGHPDSIQMTQMNGRSYVEVESLARAMNGSLTFDGNRTTLTLSGSGGNTPQAAPTAAPNANAGFSKEFLRAGIEEMSTIREWRSALTTAVENQYPISQDWLGRYQAQATTNLRLAQAAASTDADQNAASLLANEYQKMKQLNDKYVTRRENMRYISPDAVANDSLDQSIVACGKSLGAMAASGQFTDDGSCH